MLRPNKTLILSVLIIWGAVGIAGALLWEHKERKMIATSIKDFVLEDIPPHELRTRQYALLAELDPLFAFPGSDPTKLEVAISEVLETKAQFATHYEDEPRDMILNTLYPESFLEHLPETERARRALIQEPTTSNAWKYHTQLSALMKSYMRELQALSTTLESYGTNTVHFWNGVTTPEFVVASLKRIRAEIETSLAQEEKRYACTFVLSAPCDLFADTIAKKRLQTVHLPAPALEIPPYVYEHKTILTALLSDNAQEHAARLDKPKNLPLTTIVSDASLCTPRRGRTHVTLWWNAIAEATTFESVGVALLDDIYFYDLARTTDAYGQALYETGLPYDPQKLNPYLCMELGYDYGEIISAYYLWHELDQMPLFSKLSEQTIKQAPVSVQKLHDLETRIRARPFVRVEELAAFARMSEILLFTQGRSYLENMLGAEQRATLEHLILVWNTKSAWSEDSVARLTYLTNATLAALERLDIPPGVFFLTRSHLSFLYFVGNESIVPTPHYFMQTREDLTPENFDLVTYQKDLHTLYSPQELVSYLRHAAEVVEAFVTQRVAE